MRLPTRRSGALLAGREAARSGTLFCPAQRRAERRFRRGFHPRALQSIAPDIGAHVRASLYQRGAMFLIGRGSAPS